MPAVESVLLLAASGLPLAMAIALAVPGLRSRVASLAPFAGVPALALALFGSSDADLRIPWVLEHTVLVMDATARVFLGFTSVLYMAAARYASVYLREDERATRFFALFLLAMAGNLGLILAGDVPFFFTAFALMGLTSAGLVMHRDDAESRRAGRLYLSLTMVGEVVVLTGLVFLVVDAGTSEIAALHRGEPNETAMALVLAGFGIKAGALTLHFWLPLAHPAAPIPASAVLSGTMIKAGVLGWIRFLPLGESSVPAVGQVLIVAGIAAAFLGAGAGVVQSNPKTVLAYSSICQVGILMTGLGIGALRPEAWPAILTAVLVYTAHHALAKGALFLGIGPAQAARSRPQILAVRVGLLLPALALAGAPLTSGALAKVALKSNLRFLSDGWAGVLGILLPLAAVGTTLLMVRLLVLVWSPKGDALEARSEGLWAPWLLLVAAVLVGVWLLPGSPDWLSKKLTPASLWLATWPLIAGGALALLGARLRRSLVTDPARWVPPGDIGAIAERWLRRIARKLERPPTPADGHEYGDKPTDEATHPPPDLAELKRLGTAMEHRLASWPAVGSALLVVLLLLLWSVSMASG
jgi:formate hydrogenlyase subunit 3/multisubunit Na+/H+ antiporter MnhD subunit